MIGATGKSIGGNPPGRTLTGTRRDRGRPARGCWLAAWLLLAILPATSRGDSLSQPPPPWQALSPVAEVDISGAEERARAAIAAARTRLGRLLADPATPAAALASAYGDLGALYQVHDINTAAESCYANARALAPEVFRWHYLAAQLALDEGRTTQALARFETARQLDPDYPALPLRIGQALFTLNRIEAAQQAFQDAAQLPGLRALALYYLGQIALLRRDYPRAIDRFEEALALAPKAERIHYPLAQALRAAGNGDLARQHLARQGRDLPAVEDPLVQAMESLDSGARPYYEQAMQAIQDRDYASGAQELAAGLAIDPGNVEARISLARALYLSGDAAAAQHQLAQVLKQAPNQPLANLLTAVLLDDQGNAAAAAEHYRRTLAAEPKQAGAHFYLARQLFLEKHYAEAASHYAAARAADADAVVATLYRLVALLRAGASERRVLTQLEAALRTQPDQYQMRYALVRLLAASGDTQVRDPQRALEVAEKLLAELPVPPHVDAVALAHAANGDYDQAAELLQQLLFSMPWGGPPAELWRRELAAYRQRHLPLPAWPEDDTLLKPPPLDVRLIFEEYPSPVPF